VALVRAFQVPGLKLWFYSNDHEPPHFHAKRTGEWEVKVHFLEEFDRMIEVKWSASRLPSKVLKNLAELAEEHRIELLAEWEAVHAEN
jgi:hypothetical protein